ncbi:dihydroorotase [Mariniblastus fucicola]|uniref:Allantoinase n=1 Tax=Mariniblastus fucicola TaxID=980251 RepID=A0A5B9P987_9BACT|nr:dihydroorotase [Mariniblastus fucicola]QEG21795.1 Allantoinase [Mariniblastus fucicola]
MKTLIQGANVVTPDGTIEADVLIEGQLIKAIGKDLGDAETTIDASGKHLIPGVIDDQVHFREPGLTEKEDLAHATRACAKGGVTSFLEMPNTVPNTITVEALEQKLDLASEKCIVNYGFYIGATPDNVDELNKATRTPGIKIFIGSSTGNLLVDEQAALEKIFAETSLPICAHCEDETTVRANAAKYASSTDVADHSKVRDHEAALIATRRAIDLAHRHNHRFHVLHVSTGAEVDLIAEAGDLITAEACPHHLFFNIDDYARLGSLIKMNPSIKTAADNERLWQGLLDGTIGVVATDHAPHTMAEKQLPYPKCPSGLPAVENYLALMLNEVNRGRCSLQQVVSWMCEAPAKVWDIKNKGRIEVGRDADLTLVDMGLDRTISNGQQQTKCGWSPWDGETLKGWAVRTFVMGQEVYRLENGVETFSNSPTGHEIQYDHPAS